MKKRLTIEYVKQRTEEFDYRLLSTEYINNNTNLKFLCSKDHIFYMTWGNFNAGQRCPLCSNKKKGRRGIDIEYIQDYALKFGYRLLSIKYIVARDLLKFVCDEGHNISISWGNFRKGHRCKYCWSQRRVKYNNSTERDNYHSYKEYVDRLTNVNFCKYYYYINPNKFERAYEKYHLDHIYSISEGFKNNINPKIIANPYNLQMLWWKDNICKNGTSDVTKEELTKGYSVFLTNGIHIL